MRAIPTPSVAVAGRAASAGPKPEAIAARLKTDGTPEAGEAAEAVAGETGA